VISIAILVFDEIEVLDLGGPFEVFSVANRIAVARGEAAPFAITLCAQDPSRQVVARGGLRITADVHLGDAFDHDVVVVPGGDTSAIEQDQRVLDWVRRASQRADTTVSICTGAFVLARAGVLDSRPVTTHWMDIAGLRAAFPGLDVRDDLRYIDHGDLATSAGISAGIDLSLHLVGRLAGDDLAREVARRMEYRWEVEPRATSTTSAAPGRST
jgi:transcriptional regulator GlxA family with amidase domain